MTSPLRNEFLLDPGIRYLDHGAYGATPKAVFAACQQWQRRLEAQPVRFFASELAEALGQARHALGTFLKVSGDDLVYIPNATFGANLVARSLRLEPGDEVLGCDHEYGACNNAWEYVTRRCGARYLRQPIGLPASSQAALADAIWSGVTERTRAIFLSHITSPTALVMPVADICRRARAAGILTVIDGAHAPGQLDLDLGALGCDFYFGNCHKWLMSPKGAAFLHARPEAQSLIEPLVVGWGWGSDRNLDFGSDFLNATQYSGTGHYAAYLSVPAALEFHAAHGWADQQVRCRALIDEYLSAMERITGEPRLYPPRAGLYTQMGAALLPEGVDPVSFKRALYDDHAIEIPVTHWRGRSLLRMSAQAYNDAGDLEALIGAVSGLLC